MAEAPETDVPLLTAAEIEALAREWITLWQSELAALAGDREIQESWIRLLSLWAGAASALLGALPSAAASPHERSPSAAAAGAGAAQEAGAAPAAAASLSGQLALERLDHRLARLEERLATLERRLRDRGEPAPGSARPSRRARRAGVPAGRPG